MVKRLFLYLFGNGFLTLNKFKIRLSIICEKISLIARLDNVIVLLKIYTDFLPFDGEKHRITKT